MKELLKTKIAPITNEYVTHLIRLEDEVKARGQQLEKELKEAEQDRRNVKSTEAQLNVNAQVQKDALGQEMERQRNLSAEISDEISKYTKLNNSIRQKETKLDNLIKTQVDEERMASEELKKQAKITQKYEDKLDSLRFDTEKIDTRRKELDERQRLLDIRAKTLDNREEQLVNKEIGLNERELDIKSMEKRMKLAKGRVKDEK